MITFELNEEQSMIREALQGFAAEVLAPGGRLVLANPVRVGAPDDRLRLVSSTEVDLGGFACRLERWDRR